ncbi:unnamed protein product [Cercopithifilaria johnstoni]|uniref:Uncharacterized protein n=1 Tax=Cercopithifilaria johnstoni TaxID=2874296 RepID=A0A8J2LWR5_9BILA|nr:unnamed protein product [Cercopithifilaria johnstoni]
MTQYCCGNDTSLLWELKPINSKKRRTQRNSNICETSRPLHTVCSMFSIKVACGRMIGMLCPTGVWCRVVLSLGDGSFKMSSICTQGEDSNNASQVILILKPSNLTFIG